MRVHVRDHTTPGRNTRCDYIHWIWYMYCALVGNVNYVQCSHQTLLSPVSSTLEFSFDVVTQVFDVYTDSAQTTPTHSCLP